ncbi:MAG: RNA polymerase sigma-70 factor [Prolixibacteraceae bacterium]|jgi:RNA polymerase sigma-70 factor (ECF subfamily)|nr:RNA polymerase sigma-70 factor [Prolixibacteraceae bacterium]
MSKFNPDIVTQFITGDESSFKEIFNYFYPRLFHFIREYIPNNDLAENMVQETFLILWNKRNNLKEDTNINAWLYTVARNNCLKKLRDDKSRKASFFSIQLNELELEMNIEALSVLDTSDMTFSEIERIIEKTLVGLSPQCRKIFELSRFGNKKNKEIAEDLDISVKAVEGQMTKALKVIKTALKEFLPLVSCLFVG